MKNIFPIIVVAILASILTAAGHELLQGGDSSDSNGTIVSPGDENALVGEVGSYSTLGSEMVDASASDPLLQDLAMRIADLENVVAALGNDRGVVMTKEEAEELASPEAREFVLDVLAQKEEQERLDREAERQQRNEERLLREADRIAEAVGLAGADKDILFGVLLEESARRETMMEMMREDGFGGRDEMREQMRLVNEWKEQELAAKLGGNVATQITDWQSENSRGRGNFGGRMGGGGGRGGGRGGG